ncbi:hypothetical protein ACWDYH_06285 [Nocardia goodfellowii]
MRSHSSHRLLIAVTAAVIAFGATPTAAGASPGAQLPAGADQPAESGDGGSCSAPGYVPQHGQHGYEFHWVERPDEPGYYVDEGEMYWNPGGTC